jgi:hypothetical protein
MEGSKTIDLSTGPSLEPPRVGFFHEPVKGALPRLTRSSSVWGAEEDLNCWLEPGVSHKTCSNMGKTYEQSCLVQESSVLAFRATIMDINESLEKGHGTGE